VTTSIAPHVRFLGRMLRTSGPYLFLELVLPGGTLFALLLFYYQRRAGSTAAPAWPRPMARLAQALQCAMSLALDPAVTSAWRGLDNDDGLEALAMVPAK